MTSAIRPTGRPRLITRNDIITTALAILPHKVTMTAVATRLGVTVGALYRHVRNRDDLMRLVAEAHLSNRRTIADIGQPWAVLAREYARMLYQGYSGNPTLLIEYVGGAFPPASELPSMERFVGSMQARGFDGDQALALARDLRAVAIGAAAFANAMQAIDREEGLDRAVDEALTLFAADEIPVMRASIGAYRRSIRHPDWEETVTLLLEAIAARRGEDISAHPGSGD